MRGDLDVRFALRLLRLIRDVKPDIVHVHSRRGADLWGGLAGKALGVKTVLSRRVDNPEPRFPAAVKYDLYDRVIAISQAISAELIKAGVSRRKLSLVQSAVDTRRFAPVADKVQLRKEFGLGQKEAAIGMIAQFIGRKGHMDALRGFAAVHEKRPDARLIFFGKGPLMERVRACAEDMHIVGACTFAGFRDDLDRLVPCLDLVIHPARMEGLGVSLLQSAASEIPIIACPAGGIPEIVDHETTGLLVPFGSDKALAEAIFKVLDNPAWAAELGRSARRRVEAHFSLEAMVGGNAAVYRDLLGEEISRKACSESRPPPDCNRRSQRALTHK
jgi:glycosyltransferase involved in cell wall biosynthesis